MPDGGLVGESKFDILAKLPQDAVIPSARIARAAVDDRVSTLRAVADASDWSLPFVLKPDVGQRGVGVRLARSWDDARAYLAAVGDAVLAQPYHAGPFEAGIFYYRMPGATRGRIFSITDKKFPVLVGDGHSTIETLIWTHPRYRLQADTFAARHNDVFTCVLDEGERFPLAIAGNHCQGTTFRDGRSLPRIARESRRAGVSRILRRPLRYPVCGRRCVHGGPRHIDRRAERCDGGIDQYLRSAGLARGCLPGPLPAMVNHLHNRRRQPPRGCAHELVASSR